MILYLNKINYFSDDEKTHIYNILFGDAKNRSLKKKSPLYAYYDPETVKYLDTLL